MAEQKIRKTGYLWKQGGSFKNWKVRYFVLRENCLEYYKEEKDDIPKGTIDLTTGRGVRTRDQCDLDWPDKAKPGRCFGVAVENRTFYFFGDDRGAVEDWMASIQDIINRVGTPSTDCTTDALNNTETKASKMMRGGAKIMNKMTKKLSKRKDVGDQKKKNSTASQDSASGATANSANSLEEFYDDVCYDEEDASGNDQDDDLYDDVAPDPFPFTASPEPYQNVQIGTRANSSSSEQKSFQHGAIYDVPPSNEPVVEDDDEYEYDDDDSFTSEIYENI